MVVAVLQERNLINKINEGHIGAVEYRWTEIVSPSYKGIGNVVEVAAAAVAIGRVNCARQRVAELQLQIPSRVPVHVNLERIVVGICSIDRQPDPSVASILIQLVDATTTLCDQCR